MEKHQSDQELMRSLQLGDIGALEQLHLRYAEKLHYFFYRSLYSRKEEAEDFVQDFFLRLYDKCDLFDTSLSFRSWIFSIAHNMLKNHFAKQEVREKHRESEIETQSIVQFEKDLENKMQTEQLFKQLDELDLQKKEIFLLRFKEDLSIKEIAKVVDLPEGTIKSSIHYSIKRIKQKLAE